jgi:cholesterol transport system auxiliary component
VTAGACRLLVALPLQALLAGCAALAPDPAPVLSLIDRVPTDVAKAPRRAAGIVVLKPGTRPLYDTTRMAYSLRPQHVAYFARNEWAEPPGAMLRPLLVRTLEGTGAAVLTPPLTGGSALVLHTEVEELLQDFGVEPPVLRFALRAQLADGASGRVLSTRLFTQRETMGERSPGAGVAAANAAVANVLRELAAFAVPP